MSTQVMMDESPSSLRLGRYSLRLWVAVLLLGNLYLLAFLGGMFPLLVSMLIIGLVVIYALAVPVAWCEKLLHYVFTGIQMRWPKQPFLNVLSRPRPVRLVVLGLVYLGMLTLFSILLTRLLPSLQEEALAFLSDLPVIITSTMMHLNARLQELQGISPLLDALIQRIPILETTETATSVNQALIESILSPTLSWAQGFLAQGSAVINVGITRLLWLILLITFVFYALLDGETLLEYGVSYLPEQWQGQARQVLSDLHRIMVAFVEGQVVLGLLTGLYMFIIYSVFDVPYALFLSSLFAIAELLPVVGTYIGFTPGLLIMALSGNFLTLGLVFICSYLWQSLKDNILQPQIFGSALDMHPVIVLVALIICAKLGGLIGVLMAIPVSALALVTLRRLKTFERPFGVSSPRLTTPGEKEPG